MNKIRFLLVAVIMVLLLTGCEMQFGTKYVDNPNEYGKWESYLDIPSFLPASIDDYDVNSYSYTLYAYLDICYEIFLDVTVTEAQLSQLISEAKSNSEFVCEKSAYYCDGYFEIVLQDNYEIYHREDDSTLNVGWADIEKVIYNPETLNVIFVCFHANDTGVYNLDDVEYFNRFLIKEEEYVQNLE